MAVWPSILAVSIAAGLSIHLPAAGPDAPRTPQIAAPEWAPGEWWDLKIVLPHSDDAMAVRLVVADESAGSYRIGLHPDENATLAVLLRSLPLGVVSGRGGDPFQSIPFPLTEGKTWEQAHRGMRFLATARDVSETRARIDYELEAGTGALFFATYDAALGFFSSFGTTEGSFWVEGHGHAHRGEVLVPIDPRPLLLTGRRHPYSTEANPLRLPYEKVQGAPGHDRAAAFLGVGGAPGMYSARVWSRSANVELHNDDPGTEGYHQRWIGLDDLEGLSAQVAGSGPGASVVEIVGYREERLTLGVKACPECEGIVPEEASSSVAAWVGAVVLVAAMAWRRRLQLLGLYARLARDRLLDHGTRERILDAVRREPGASTQEIRRRLGIPWSTAVHHLDQLRRHEFVADVTWGRRRHWYARDMFPAATQRIAHSALRQEAARRVYEAIVGHPGAHLARLAELLGLQHTTVRFHVRRLADAGLLREERAGRLRRFFATGFGGLPGR